MIDLTDQQVDVMFSELLLGEFVAGSSVGAPPLPRTTPPPLVVGPSPSPRECPPAGGDGPATLEVTRVAPVAPPPPFYRRDGRRTRTYECLDGGGDADIRLHAATQDKQWRPALLRLDWMLEAYGITPSPLGYVVLWKGLCGDVSPRGALFRAGCVTEDLTHHGLYFTPTKAWVQYWVPMGKAVPVAVRLDDITWWTMAGPPKLRASRCYTMR